MFNQNSNVFMNGGHAPQRYGMPMGSSKSFQPNQHHQPHHQRQQDHSGYSNHQHNASTSNFSSNTPAFAPNNIRNGTPNQMQNGVGRAVNEHWQLQLALADQARAQTGTHPHARNHQSGKLNGTNGLEQGRRDGEKDDQERTTQPAEAIGQPWAELDLGGQGLRSLSPALFAFPFLKKLYLSHNKLDRLSPTIGKLHNLTHLDLSLNNLSYLPAEIGMLTKLKSLLLFDNNLEEIPPELAYLYQLEMLGIEGNHALEPSLRRRVEEHGTKGLIKFLQENPMVPDPPNDRDWITIEDARPASTSRYDKLSVMSYNILCERTAAPLMYGYTSPHHLAWDYRKQLVISEIRARNPDILCLQEVEQDVWHELLRPELAHNGYKGTFFAKARARTMMVNEAKTVDGCATLYKDKTWILLDKQTIEFAKVAINRPDMKGGEDVFNRVMPRDHIALCTFLENRATGARLIVVNVHLEWNPVYRDVKLIQVAIMMEQLARLAETWSRWPPCKDKEYWRFADGDADADAAEATEPAPEPAPSQEYASGDKLPLLVCGDFNSTSDSGVYELLANGSVPKDHVDLGHYQYGLYTKHGMKHPFSLRSSYDNKDMPFTNYTPGFKGMIDYIWYSGNALQVTGLLGEVDKDYLQRVPGFPNAHFPSDHLSLMVELAYKARKGEGQAAVSAKA